MFTATHLTNVLRTVRRMLVVLPLLVAGCGGDDGPLSSRERNELARARVRWNASVARDAYRYEIRLSCFCPSELGQWNTVTVVNGLVTAVVSGRGDVVPPAEWGQYTTVDRLFAVIDARDDPYLADVQARYDSQYGYPVEVSFTARPGLADSDITYFARNLQPIPVTRGASGS